MREDKTKLTPENEPQEEPSSEALRQARDELKRRRQETQAFKRRYFDFYDDVKISHRVGPELRTRYGVAAGVFGICSNAVICALKLAVGFVSGSVTSPVIPVPGEKRGTRIRPESMTVVMPSIVREVSAMDVARITFRRALGAKTRSCSSFGRLP